MTLAPRAVVVHRSTEYEDLVARHGTHGQAAFALTSRGRDIDEVVDRHRRQQEALHAVAAAVPLDWRRGTVERADLPRFLFAPDDVVVAVGQDGLVANVAKYLDGQPVVGIDPDPSRNAGVLVRHPPRRAGAAVAAGAALLEADVTRASGCTVEVRTMVEARTDDGQTLTALNEVFLGHPSHQTARYDLAIGGRVEAQASSGVIVATGTGATGWCRSAWLERRSTLVLPSPAEPSLAWFVREAWPSPATGTALTEGLLGGDAAVSLVARSDRLVVFGDGMEADALTVTWGQEVSVTTSARRLRLVVPAPVPPRAG